MAGLGPQAVVVAARVVVVAVAVAAVVVVVVVVVMGTHPAWLHRPSLRRLVARGPFDTPAPFPVGQGQFRLHLPRLVRARDALAFTSCHPLRAPWGCACECISSACLCCGLWWGKCPPPPLSNTTLCVFSTVSLCRPQHHVLPNARVDELGNGWE